MGHAVLESPVIAIAPRAVTWPREPVTGVIATSAHAFPDFAETRDIPPDVRAAPLFLVGARTEDAARRAGFTGAALVAPDGAALSALPLARTFGRLLYLAGRDRKPAVETMIAAAGRDLIVLETYAAVAAGSFTPDSHAALADGGIDAVLHYSRRAATLFLALAAAAGIDPATTAHLCLSQDVAAPLRSAARVIRVAKSPDEAALLALLRDG